MPLGFVFYFKNDVMVFSKPNFHYKEIHTHHVKQATFHLGLILNFNAVLEFSLDLGKKHAILKYKSTKVITSDCINLGQFPTACSAKTPRKLTLSLTLSSLLACAQAEVFSSLPLFSVPFCAETRARSALLFTHNTASLLN